jgi:hypothetical protein
MTLMLLVHVSWLPYERRCGCDTDFGSVVSDDEVAAADADESWQHDANVTDVCGVEDVFEDMEDVFEDMCVNSSVYVFVNVVQM